MTLQLTFTNGPETGRAFVITDGPFTVGRTAEADIVVHWDGRVSSRHLRIECEQGQYTLTDVGSTNGTRVNGQRVDQVILQDGDEIHIGETRLLVQLAVVRSSSIESIADSAILPASTVTYDRPLRRSASSSSAGSSPIEGSISDFAPEPPGIDTAQGRSPRRASSPEPFPPVHRFAPSVWDQSVQSVQSLSNFPEPMAQKPRAEHSPAEHSPVETRQRAYETPVGSQPSIHQVRLRVSGSMIDSQQTTLHWLNPGQMLSVGRSFASDCCVHEDDSLADNHFVLECTSESCTITDLNTESGTWVNGGRITKTELYDQDCISAGRTEFYVEVETLGGLIKRAPPSGDVQPVVVETLLPSARAKWNLPAKQLSSNNGTFAVAGQFPPGASPQLFLDASKGLGFIYLLIDFARIGEPFPADLDIDQSKLFAWLPAVAARRSVHLFTGEQLENYSDILDDAWGCDAVSILLSSFDMSELMEALQDLLRDPQRNGDRVDGIVGFCWPSVVRMLLSQDASGFASTYFDCVQCLITEGKLDSEWQLFMRDAQIGAKLLQRLSQAGVNIVVEQPGESAAPVLPSVVE